MLPKNVVTTKFLHGNSTAASGATKRQIMDEKDVIINTAKRKFASKIRPALTFSFSLLVFLFLNISQVVRTIHKITVNQTVIPTCRDISSGRLVPLYPHGEYNNFCKLVK